MLEEITLTDRTPAWALPPSGYDLFLVARYVPAPPRVPFNARKTHCPQNHPYDEVNTYVHNGHRYCRTCNRTRARKPTVSRETED